MKRALKIAGAFVGILLLIAGALTLVLNPNRFRPALEARLSEALGRDVKVGNLKLAFFPPGITASDLSVADDPAFSSSPFLGAKSLHVGIDLHVLVLSRKLKITSLIIAGPQIRLLESPSGKWNFSSLSAHAAPAKAAPATAVAPPPPGAASRLDLAAKLLTISSGRFTLGRTDGHLRPLVLEKVEVEVRDFAPDRAFPFSLTAAVAGGGSIKLDGSAGPIDTSDLALTPASIHLKVDQLDLAGSGLNDRAPDAAGLVSFDGGGISAAGAVELNGKVRIEKLKLAAKGTPAKRNPELDFHVTCDWRKRTGTVHQADVHIGGALVQLTGTYAAPGDSLAVRMNLAGRDMPVEELAEMLPPMGIALPNGSSLKGGTSVVQADIEGPLDRLVTTGSVSVQNTKLAGFNLSSKLSAIERLAGIRNDPDTEIQELSGKVRIAPEGINADALKLVLPALGDVNGSGTVNPDRTLNFKMQAAVRTSGIAAVLNWTPIPFTVDGTCAEPVFHPDLMTVVKGVGEAAGGLLKGLMGGKK